MTVLTATKTWSRALLAPARRTPAALSPEESASVRRALLFLRTRAGGTAKLAAQLGVTVYVVNRGALTKGRPGAGLALRLARLAGVSVEALLSGAWPKEGTCPHCGPG